MHTKKIIPVGVDSFEKIIDGNYYYVDKTGFVKDIIDKSAEVTLITRPRRFGKTINMLMLKSFFEISQDSKRSFFEQLSIGQHAYCMEQQGTYPVIFFTFGSVKEKTQEKCLNTIEGLIAEEFLRHMYLLQSPALENIEKEHYVAVARRTASSDLYSSAIKHLSNYLYRHHGVRPIVLIDEYDAPLLEAYTSKNQDYYNTVIGFMRTFLTSGLKTNPALHKAVITGVTRIARESLFSGFNNAFICPVTSNFYSAWFGFTEDDVKTLVEYYNPPVSLDQIKHWYDGYSMGTSRHIYNPWSMLNMLYNNGELQQYWINAGSNDLIKEVIASRAAELQNDIELLINGQAIRKKVLDSTTFDTLHTHDDTAWNLLLTGGYLSFTNLADRMVDLCIPNKEIQEFFVDTITTWCQQHLNTHDFIDMLTALTEGHLDEFENFFINFVKTSFSHRDIGGNEPEAFYHAFVFGLFSSLQADYRVVSNRESGLGTYDLAIIPHDTRRAGIIIEFKRVSSVSQKTAEEAALQALQQINTLEYEQELHANRITKIIKLGIAFKGKQVAIKHT